MRARVREVLPETVPSLVRPAERRLWSIAFGAAVLLHALALLISFPEARRQTPQARTRRPIVVRRYVPPPPPIERRQATVAEKHTRKMPIPDPTPDTPEPIREPAPEIVFTPLPVEGDPLIGDPVPPGPPAAGADEPLLAGVGGTTLPVRIEESYVPPEYPEVARLARVEGSVILHAIIYRDGTVGEIEILRSTQPSFGFEQAAILAVRQWRYRPARHDGRPVSVYFTILVDFSLV